MIGVAAYELAAETALICSLLFASSSLSGVSLRHRWHIPSSDPEARVHCRSAAFWAKARCGSSPSASLAAKAQPLW